MTKQICLWCIRSAILVCGVLLAAPFSARAVNSDAPYLANLSALDDYVANKYADLTNNACCFPPGPLLFGINCMYLTFAANSDLAVLTNALPSNIVLGVPVYPATIIETQGTTRVWLYEAANGVPFRTNNAPASFNAEEWVRIAYQNNPPAWLTGTNLARWYADRDRSRLALMMTLIKSNDWPVFCANTQMAATNNPASGTPPPTKPADTNCMSIVSIQATNNATQLWIYTPSNRPIAMLTRATLVGGSNTWSMLGTINATAPFQFWQTSAGASNVFYFAGYSDLDSDGDGIPDVLEIYVFGTNPFSADSDNDGTSDYEELYISGTDPNNPDSTPPAAVISSPPSNYNLTWLP